LAPAIGYAVRINFMDSESLLKQPLTGMVVTGQPDDPMPVAEALCLTVAAQCFYCFA
jgi:hypothetical protein